MRLATRLVRNTIAWIRKTVYFDNNATTPLDPNVKKFIASILSFYGNPSSIHSSGSRSRELIEWARQQVAGVINASPDEIVLTSGATEANNTVIKTVAAIKSKGHFITSAIEHPSVLQVHKSLEKKGFPVTYLKVNKSGMIDLTKLTQAIRPDTVLISIMHVNNEIGSIQPIEEIAQIAQKHSILFHSDIVQSFSKFPINVKELPVDYLSFSAHKIYGPKGIGGLYVREGRPLEPLIEGGHQEKTLRAGTESLFNIAGFGKAAEIARQVDLAVYRNNLLAIKKALYEGIKSVFPDAQINGDFEQGSPTTLNIFLPGVDNREFIAFLDFYRIEVSTGSACISGSDEPSHVLLALGLTPEEALSSFRIGIGRFNTISDAESFIKILHYFISESQDFFDYLFPQDLTPAILSNPAMLVVEIRTAAQRKKFKSFPGAIISEISMSALRKLPKDKSIILMCEDGYLANIYALRLKNAGWKNVKAVFGGHRAWRTLYQITE